MKFGISRITKYVNTNITHVFEHIFVSDLKITSAEGHTTPTNIFGGSEDRTSTDDRTPASDEFKRAGWGVLSPMDVSPPEA